jgi:glycosyltransferase involved in cell wall biosynthesis
LTRGAGSRSVPPVTRDLRIAIDLRPLALDSVTGVGVVIGQILEGLDGEGVTFVGVSDRPVPQGRIPATIPVAVQGGAGGRIRWEWSVLPRLLRRFDPAPDLFHATWNHGLPSGLPFPSVLTIHDLIPWRHPGDVPWPKPALLHRALYRHALSSSARRAAAIVTVSEASRRDIEALLPRAASRVEVVPNPLPSWFIPAETVDGLTHRARLSGGRPYWLYLGGFDPRKGLITLLSAMVEAFPDRSSTPDLVLAGASNAHAREVETMAARLGLRAQFPGYVRAEGLPSLFSGASLFIYPSRHEGFGIPLLFAMASGVPIVAGDGGSIPEVVGDAGMLFPAGDVRALAEILRRAAADPAFLAPYAARGPERARRFSAKEFGERMLRVYARAASSRREYA